MHKLLNRLIVFLGGFTKEQFNSAVNISNREYSKLNDKYIESLKEVENLKAQVKDLKEKVKRPETGIEVKSVMVGYEPEILRIKYTQLDRYQQSISEDQIANYLYDKISKSEKFRKNVVIRSCDNISDMSRTYEATVLLGRL